MPLRRTTLRRTSTSLRRMIDIDTEEPNTKESKSKKTIYIH